MEKSADPYLRGMGPRDSAFREVVMKRENQEHTVKRIKALFVQDLARIEGKQGVASTESASGPFTTFALAEESGA
ncbi:uncharacterized protein STAUR_7329 [Stigmatella aurantiaca DW4/3-1]|uniref:Uncharacterized protein n=2 Tax=Stigmatella aurantiaca TaxID=41 RepID=E3FD80_STIAD|nr:uncharacterized protein STAUR_7329 [Stigmatella aurantiaca DW4/3-1]